MRPYSARTVRKDRYNRKISKFYVVYEENDTDLSENEECEELHDQEAGIQYSCMVIGS